MFTRRTFEHAQQRQISALPRSHLTPPDVRKPVRAIDPGARVHTCVVCFCIVELVRQSGFHYGRQPVLASDSSEDTVGEGNVSSSHDSAYHATVCLVLSGPAKEQFQLTQKSPLGSRFFSVSGHVFFRFRVQFFWVSGAKKCGRFPASLLKNSPS